MSLISVLQYGKYFPMFLPVISIFSGMPHILTIALFADMVFVNPFLKMLLGYLGLQSKRPYCPDMTTYTCFGMPSGHTEVHFIFLTYLLSDIYNKYSEGTEISRGTIALTSVIGIMTGIVMWQRWYSKRHTVKQIAAGALVGIGIGIGTGIGIAALQQL